MYIDSRLSISVLETLFMIHSKVSFHFALEVRLYIIYRLPASVYDQIPWMMSWSFITSGGQYKGALDLDLYVLHKQQLIHYWWALQNQIKINPRKYFPNTPRSRWSWCVKRRKQGLNNEYAGLRLDVHIYCNKRKDLYRMWLIDTLSNILQPFFLSGYIARVLLIILSVLGSYKLFSSCFCVLSSSRWSRWPNSKTRGFRMEGSRVSSSNLFRIPVKTRI